MTSRLLRGNWAFADSSAYYALADSSDSNHRAAIAVQTRILRERWRLLTTNFILAETYALLLNRANRDTAFRVVSSIIAGATTIIRVTSADEDRAWQILEQYDDKEFSLVDGTSFAVMERLGIPTAFAFDEDFTQ